MAFEIPGLIVSVDAGADLSSNQYFFVKLNSSGQVVAIAANTDIPFGILQNKPSASGQSASVMLYGVSKCVASADLTPANVIGPSANGRAAAYANGTDTTKYVCGHVLDDNTGANGFVSVAFSCLTPNRGA